MRETIRFYSKDLPGNNSLFFPMESTLTGRCRPLHTCGVVILSIAHGAYTRSQDFNGPLGSMIRKISRLAELGSPIIYALQYQLLGILSFSDYVILAFENIFETLFPPSKHVFNKIDKLVQTAEILPGKFDDAINKFPLFINQAPMLDWALIQIISWLNFWISTLTHWGFENAREKEIVMDSNSSELSSANQPRKSLSQNVSPNKEKFPPKPQSQEDETDAVNKHVKKGTYKEALEKGTKENIENKDCGTMEETRKQFICQEGGGKGGRVVSRTDENISINDPILELFESGWLMNTATDGKGNWLSRSVSYTMG